MCMHAHRAKAAATLAHAVCWGGMTDLCHSGGPAAGQFPKHGASPEAAGFSRKDGPGSPRGEMDTAAAGKENNDA